MTADHATRAGYDWTACAISVVVGLGAAVLAALAVIYPRVARRGARPQRQGRHATDPPGPVVGQSPAAAPIALMNALIATGRPWTGAMVATSRFSARIVR